MIIACLIIAGKILGILESIESTTVSGIPVLYTLINKTIARKLSIIVTNLVPYLKA